LTPPAQSFKRTPSSRLAARSSDRARWKGSLRRLMDQSLLPARPSRRPMALPLARRLCLRCHLHLDSCSFHPCLGEINCVPQGTHHLSHLLGAVARMLRSVASQIVPRLPVGYRRLRDLGCLFVVAWRLGSLGSLRPTSVKSHGSAQRLMSKLISILSIVSNSCWIPMKMVVVQPCQ